MSSNNLKNSANTRAKLIQLIARQQKSNDNSLFNVSAHEHEAEELRVGLTGTDNAKSSSNRQNIGTLALGTDALVPSENARTLQNAFHSMRGSDPRQKPLKLGKSEVDELAADAVKRVIQNVTEDKISDYIDTLLRARVGLVFDEISEQKIQNAIAQNAPAQILEMIKKVAPKMIEGAVKATTEDVLNAEMDNLTIAIEQSVKQLVRQELHGSFGSKVTENIKSLIHIEVAKLRSHHEI
ncbi:hypothetical protein BFP76_08130 [Amylibacter kogurei]|uniref:Uncharacterized protein n=1 Tax=Paramylibacter kogurei TaxID=1889778 RepID=A0A2G5K3L9_9RHOB|nr:hypothetical protein [Amylibacter kogurei]PIB23500.1 hypothetical protein BFP76_08130 [Amylibacter kogurei]